MHEKRPKTLQTAFKTRVKKVAPGQGLQKKYFISIFVFCHFGGHRLKNGKIHEVPKNALKQNKEERI